jgi:response regulator RpfG family c-di-GMP phosphodiesterase
VPSPAKTAAFAAKTKRICDWLVKDRALKPEQVDAVVTHVQRTGERVEEVVISLGLVSEGDLLKVLATQYQVYFASSEKLAKADVGRAMLDMVPQRFAEKIGVCPVVFDAKTHILTVVTADPDDLEALQEVQIASGAREIKAVLARPAAVKALIGKAYLGDIHAFALLDRQAHAHLQSMLEVYQGNVLQDDSGSLIRAEPKTRSRERVLSEKDLAQGSIPPKPKPTTAPAAPPPPAPVPVPPPPPSAVGDSLELLNVLVSLLENTRPDLRGHSSQVGRLARRVAESMGLSVASVEAIVAAAYIHDLGKMGQYHLTAYNSAEYDGHKLAAQKTYGIPSRVLEPGRLSAEAIAATTNMYERFDGKGLPNGLSGKDIPLGARVLAICDTYADLTQNPRNPFRKALTAQEACDALVARADTIFDPNLVDVFRHTMLGEDLKARLLANRPQALLVDADPEETTVLELRLIEQGFIVEIARTPEQALKLLEKGDTDLVVSELDLAPQDGLALLAEARKTPAGKDVPWVVYTRRQERNLAQKAFELGVLDFVNKPAHADVLVAKLKALLDLRAPPRLSRGVSGQLRELGLPDMVQVLFHGRKSGNLKIRAPQGAGEIHFADGSVVNALWGDMRGEEAFFAMLKLTDGEFGLDPTFQATARVIDQSSEALLLEGMRRMDESAAG